MAKYDPDEFFDRKRQKHTGVLPPLNRCSTRIFVEDTNVPSKLPERYPLPITCGECGHKMRPVHKHMVPDMPRTYFCTFCGAGFHEDNPGIRFREKRTNADRIRALSDEELAEFHSGPWVRYGCVPHGKCVNDCTQCWLNWLKSPVEAKSAARR